MSYSSAEIRDFHARYGSVRGAEDAARRTPDGEEIRRVDRQLASVREAAYEARRRPFYPAERRELRELREFGAPSPELLAAEWARLHALRCRLVVAALKITEEPPGDKSQGVVLPTHLVEAAMRLHKHKRYGRPKLQAELPGLGDWGARAVLHAAKAGKPFGLWLDEEDDRLRWGAAITEVWAPGAAPGAGARANAPAPPKLRLPRP